MSNNFYVALYQTLLESNIIPATAAETLYVITMKLEKAIRHKIDYSRTTL